MIAPLILVLVSLGAVAAALAVPAYSDFLLLAAPCAIASLILLGVSLIRERRARKKTGLRWILVDGSNVMHWDDGTPKIAPVVKLVEHLSQAGYEPGVVFDANAGYKLGGQYMDDRALAQKLNLNLNRVMVVPRGTPADSFILNAARELGAAVVTNDRFRDWAEDYPEVREPGYLIKGSYRAGKLNLRFPADT